MRRSDTGDTDSGTAPDFPNPTRMLPREQQVGYLMAGVAGAISLGLATTQHHDVLIGGLGVGATVLLALAVRHGHRIITAATGFLVALTLGLIFPLEVAFLVFSGYLMMRTSNAQGKIRRSQAPLSPADRRAAAEARAAERAERRGAKGKGATATGEAATPKLPPANRRYTPPKGKPTRRP